MSIIRTVEERGQRVPELPARESKTEAAAVGVTTQTIRVWIRLAKKRTSVTGLSSSRDSLVRNRDRFRSISATGSTRVVTDGVKKGTTYFGIYELDGDMLKECSVADKKEFPKEFKAGTYGRRQLNWKGTLYHTPAGKKK
jgi:hypothetical protein